jgi:hypothetical protein
MAEHVNAHRRYVQLQTMNSVLLSTQNFRLPVGTTRAKKWSFSIVDRIGGGCAYQLVSIGPSHTVSHASALTFHVSLLKHYVHDNLLVSIAGGH